MKKPTQLNVTPAMQNMAESYGAYFDKDLGVWFMDGEFPGPLVALEVKMERRRDYVNETVPQCEQYGSQMMLKTNRTTRDAFWRCAMVRCGWSRPYIETRSSLAQRSAFTPQEPGRPSFEDRLLASSIIERAIGLFRSETAAMRWLQMLKSHCESMAALLWRL
jgi:hypothetical protein